MSKYIKNNTGSDQTWVGQLLSAGEYYLIQTGEEVSWMNSSGLLTAIGSGDAIVASADTGSEDITDVAQGINYLKDVASPTDVDGAPLTRTKITKTGWHFQLHGVEFCTSGLGSLYNKDKEGADLGFCSLKFYNSSDVELVAGTQAELDSNCTKTVMDIEIDHDIEVIGGTVEQPTPPTTDIRMWVTAIPDLTIAQGGSVEFAQGGVNLRYISKNLDLDGKTPKLLPYSATYHTNKFRVTMRHAAGEICPVHMLFKLFKENV